MDTIIPSESGFEGSAKLEIGEQELPLESEPRSTLWTPGTLTRMTVQVTEQLSRLAEANSELVITRESERGSVERIMDMMLQMQTQENEKRYKREEDRRRDDLRREERLIEALRQAQPAVPQTVTIVNQKLPEMREGEDIDTFVAVFKAVLRANNIPQAQCSAKLHSQLNVTTKLRIQDVIQDEDATYDDIKEELLGCSNMTFSAASETLLSGDRGKLYSLPHRQCKDRLMKLVEKVTRNAATLKEANQAIVIAFMRQNLVPALKTYVDLKGNFASEDFSRTIDEWESTQPVGTTCFKKQSTVASPTQSKPLLNKKTLSCFFCGKLVHISKECHSRIASEKQTSQQQHPIVETEQSDTVANTSGRPAKREITCFLCHQKGHMSPQCPQRQTQVKKVQIPLNKVVPLKENQLFGSVGSHRIPITCDSGADIMVVPEECVAPDQFMEDNCDIDSFNMVRSSGKLCNVVVTINGNNFTRRAVTQPGRDLAWTACLSLPFTNCDDWSFITEQMKHKFKLSEEETLYLPPEMKQRILVSGLLVSEGTLVDVKDTPVTSMISEQPLVVDEPQGGSSNEESQNATGNDVQIEKITDGEEVEQNGRSELILENVEQPSVLAEVDGAPLEGSAETGDVQDISIEGYVMTFQSRNYCRRHLMINP